MAVSAITPLTGEGVITVVRKQSDVGREPPDRIRQRIIEPLAVMPGSPGLLAFEITLELAGVYARQLQNRVHYGQAHGAVGYSSRSQATRDNAPRAANGADSPADRDGLYLFDGLSTAASVRCSMAQAATSLAAGRGSSPVQ
jgi:hypothetical protein